MTRGAWVFEHLDRIEVAAPTPEAYADFAELLERRATDEADLKVLRQMFGFERTPAPRAHPERVAHACAVGVRWHEEQQVPECMPCRRWRLARTVHGTEQSCQAHYQDGTELCPQCQAFYDERHTGRRRLPSGASCGSAAGYRRHIRLGEPICGPCREADRLTGRENRIVREQAAARAKPSPQVDGIDSSAAHAGEQVGVGEAAAAPGAADGGEADRARGGHVRQQRRVACGPVGVAAGR